VQGEEAVPSIINGIHALEQLGVNTIIVGRGGGSIEDLWAFNDERVAQAIFDCTIPIISAVGHETDTTIADYVADLRAPTPSAAAELAVYEWEQLQNRLAEYEYTLQQQMNRVLKQKRSMVEQYSVRLKGLSPMHKIRMKRMQAMQLEERLQNAMGGKITQKRHQLAIYVEKMKGLSPLDKLSQGYAYVADADGKTLSGIDQTDIGETVTVYLKNGKLKTLVTEKQRETWEKIFNE
jgi:exodeoxyribonuclease VII large subunit